MAYQNLILPAKKPPNDHRPDRKSGTTGNIGGSRVETLAANPPYGSEFSYFHMHLSKRSLPGIVAPPMGLTPPHSRNSGPTTGDSYVVDS